MLGRTPELRREGCLGGRHRWVVLEGASWLHRADIRSRNSSIASRRALSRSSAGLSMVGLAGRRGAWCGMSRVKLSKSVAGL
jgi:hypothetical protein